MDLCVLPWKYCSSYCQYYWIQNSTQSSFIQNSTQQSSFVRGWICVSFPGIAAFLLSGLCSLSLISSAGSNTLLSVISLHKWSLIMLIATLNLRRGNNVQNNYSFLNSWNAVSESLFLHVSCVISVVWNWFPQNAPPVAKTIWQQQNSGTFLGR